MKIRQAQKTDVEPIAALVESAYRGESSRAGWTTEADLLAGPRTSSTEVAGLIAAAGSRVLVADDDGVLSGCCHLALRPDDTAYFGMFAVSPARQSEGIGGALLDEAERIARQAGAQVLHMTVLRQRSDLIAWYERRGYLATGTGRPFPSSATSRPRVDGLWFADLAKALGSRQPD